MFGQLGWEFGGKDAQSNTGLIAKEVSHFKRDAPQLTSILLYVQFLLYNTLLHYPDA